MDGLFEGWTEGDQGADTPQDKVLLQLVAAARDYNDPIAALRLGRKAAAEDDIDRSIKLYQFVMDATAQHKDPVSQLARYNAKFHLAVAYYDGRVEESSASAAVEKGVALIRDIVGHEKVPSIPSEYESAMAEIVEIEEIIPHADIIRSAQFNLAMAHLNGAGVKQSNDMAIGWFQKAARNGCAQSMHALGRYYAGGTPIDPISVKETNYIDAELARKWHLKSAEAGYPEAMAAIGTILSLQEDANEASSIALKWLKCAANCGSIAALSSLSLLYYRLHFYNKSVQWSTRIANRDCEADTDADPMNGKFLALGCWLLGRCHELGRGIEKSREKADVLYHRASKLDVDTVSRVHMKL